MFLLMQFTTFQLSTSSANVLHIPHPSMASDGVWDTPWDAILWAIYTDMHVVATSGKWLIYIVHFTPKYIWSLAIKIHGRFLANQNTKNALHSI